MVLLRQSIRDYFTFADKHLVKMIMSKFEVLANNRIQKELTYLSGIFDTIMDNKFKESKMKILTFDIQKGAIVAAQLFLVVYV